MSIVLWIVVGLLFAFGFLGCFINKFPGPLCSFLAVLVLKFGLKFPFAIWALILVGILVVVSMVVARQVVPSLMKKVTPFTKGATGTTVGSIIGITIWACIMKANPEAGVALQIAVILLGLVVIPFVCAYLFEIAVQKNNSKAIKSSTAATAVYLVNTFIKIAVLVVSLYLAFKFHAD